MSGYMPDWTYFEYDTSDLDAAAIAIYRFADYIDDEAVLEGAKRIAMDDMAKRFENETDPFGIPWAPLTPAYAESKAAAGYPARPILSRTYHDDNPDSLRSAATSESAWSVSAESVWFHTDGLPPYWEAHESGAGPRLSFKEVGGKQYESGEHAGLPQRRFIGLSDGARDEVLALVGAWVESGMVQTAAPFQSTSGTSVGRKIVKGAGGKPQWHIGGKWGPMV